MAEVRNITVKLIADTHDYVAAIEQAKDATIALSAVLKELGITTADMPAAITSVLSLVKDARAS
jgi:hypothetical protein